MADTERLYATLIANLSDGAAAHSTNRQMIRDIVKSLHLYPTLTGEIGVVSERFSYGNILRHGADPTGVSDSWAAIQNCVDTVLYFALTGGGNKVIAPAGSYKTTDTVQLGYGLTPTSIVFEGEGYKYRGQNGFAGTAIVPTQTDRPAFNFQGARGSVLRNLAIVGKLSIYIDAQGLCGASPSIDDTIAANWDDASQGIVDNRYAPYAAVTVDAYSGTQPGTHYPTVTYPSFLGAVSQYGKAFSSDVLIENCHLGGFTVLVAVQPSDADGNGDFTCIRRCWLEKAKWAVSVGNSQSRSVSISDCKGGSIYSVLTNNQHGKRIGKFGGTITNLSIFTSIWLFTFGEFYSGPIVFDNFFGESMWKIGSVTTSGSTTEPAMIFNGGQFGFQNQTDARGVPAWVLEGGNSGDFKFKGCTFGNYPSVVGMQPNNLEFDGSFFRCDTRTNPYEQYAHNATAGGLVTPFFQVNSRARLKSSHFNLNTGARATTPGYTDRWKYSDRTQCIPFYGDKVMALNEEWDDLPNPAALMPSPDVKAKSSLSALTLVGKTLTITFASRVEDSFLKYGPLPGDVVIDDQTGMVFFVRSRTALVAIAEAQSNYKAGAALVAFSTTVGNLYFKSSRWYTPSRFLRGDQTAASAVLTNCGDDNFGALYDSEIAAGDMIIVFPARDRWAAPASSIITARSQAAGTITLTAATGIATVLKKRRDFFARTGPANI